MTTSVEPHAWEIFRAAFGDNSVLMPFAREVALHLTRSGALAREESLLELVVELLRPGPSEVSSLAPKLAASPVLLASFFQNLDLLPPSASETARVALLVAEALEIISAEAE